jgi:hypothetical protein
LLSFVTGNIRPKADTRLGGHENESRCDVHKRWQLVLFLPIAVGTIFSALADTAIEKKGDAFIFLGKKGDAFIFV